MYKASSISKAPREHISVLREAGSWILEAGAFKSGDVTTCAGAGTARLEKVAI